MKKRLPKFYVITKETPRKFGWKKEIHRTVISANKIVELEEILPSEEALQIHMEIQRLKLKSDKNYQPLPLELTIERGIFNDIIRQIKGYEKDHIALFLQVPGIPICMLYPLK